VAKRRGVQVVLTLIVLAVVVSVVSVVLMFLALNREPSVPRSATLVLEPGGGLPELESDDVVGQLFQAESTTVQGLVDALRKAARDSRVRTVLLRPSTLDLPYWGKLQELRDAIAAFRDSGKMVVAFLEYGGDREYYLASAADRVYLLPTSPLDLTGVASYEVFLRGGLDRLGVYPDYVSVGDYKAAPNQYAETGFTDTHREMAESLNRDMYDQLVEGIATSRSLTPDAVRALLDRGPIGADDALAAGLVDGLVYEDQLEAQVPELGERDGADRISASAYARISPGSAGFRPASRIAVLYAVGIIASGRSGFDPLNGTVMGSDSFVEQIRRVREDDSVRAIVLRIDSPGGSAVASDVIWRELMLAREEDPSRPLVASMSDLAASGGYYIAMASEAIVAQPGTLTGSIGVYGGKLALGDALDKLDIGHETVASSPNASIYSPFEPFTPAQRERLQDYMAAFYDTFVGKAAASRGVTPEAIDEVAGGRVWTGRQALDRGLVDALGGLDVAVAMAKERAGIPADEDVELVVYPMRRTLLEALTEQFDASGAGMGSLLAGRPERRAVAALTAPARLFRRGEPLALMPFAFVR
jgi:protease-4